MHRRIKAKWRPSLALVIGGTLIAVLAAPTFGLILLRVLADDIGMRNAVSLVGAGVVLVTLVLGYLLWRLILGPLRRLATESEAFSEGQTTPYNPQAHYGTREVQELGQSVLDMAEGLHNKQETVRSYTNHVTHELKSPLTALVGAAELLEDEAINAKQRGQLLGTVRKSADRMQVLLEGMREIAAAREPLGKGSSTIAQVLERIKEEYTQLEFRADGAAVPLPIPAEGLEIILHQTVGNAAAHGASVVQLWANENPPSLTVQDNGTGISQGNRDRLFEPFFTTRREDGGTGMGLAIVRSLLETRGAQIDLLERTQGAAFEIRF